MTTDKRMVTLAESDGLRAQMHGRVDPQSLIAAAITQGAPIETLERLVQLSKDVRAIVAKEAYNEAIAEFQRRCPAIKKNKLMAVPGRPDYRYADLGEILPAIAPLMGELGLSVSWRHPPVKPGVVETVCRISHKLGHSEESGSVEIPYRADGRMNGAQAVGSALTYAKRYSLTSALGISPEDDDDGKGSGETGEKGGDTTQKKTSRSKGSAAPPPRTVETAEAPTNPDAPELVDESRNLFPSPEADEREALVKRIQTAGAKLTKQARGHLKELFLGDAEADITKGDLAALDALARHLEESAKK